MARKFIQYPPGTPEREIQDAIAERYGDNNEAFFAALADRLSIRPDSASGTFYGYLAKKRGLPENHRRAYVVLLGVTEETILQAERPAVNVRHGQDPLAALEAKVAALTEALDVAKTANERLRGRVLKLERHTGLRPAGQEAPATAQGANGP